MMVLAKYNTNYATRSRIEPTPRDRPAMPNHTHHQTHFRLGTIWSDGCYKVVIPCHDESTSIVGP